MRWVNRTKMFATTALLGVWMVSIKASGQTFRGPGNMPGGSGSQTPSGGPGQKETGSCNVNMPVKKKEQKWSCDIVKVLQVMLLNQCKVEAMCQPGEVVTSFDSPTPASVQLSNTQSYYIDLAGGVGKYSDVSVKTGLQISFSGSVSIDNKIEQQDVAMANCGTVFKSGHVKINSSKKWDVTMSVTATADVNLGGLVGGSTQNSVTLPITSSDGAVVDRQEGFSELDLAGLTPEKVNEILTTKINAIRGDMMNALLRSIDFKIGNVLQSISTKNSKKIVKPPQVLIPGTMLYDPNQIKALGSKCTFVGA